MVSKITMKLCNNKFQIVDKKNNFLANFQEAFCFGNSTGE